MVSSKTKGEEDFYVEMKGCYGGREGTWIVLEEEVEGEIKMSVKGQEWVWERGEFTEYSKECYYIEEGLPEKPENK